MDEGGSVVATYSSYTGVEDAVKVLHHSGYDITQLSILYAGSHVEERIVGFFSEDQRVRYWGRLGVIWGSVFGLISGTSLFYAPSVTAGLVLTLIAAVLGGGLLIGGLTAVGAIVYGKVLTVDVPLKYPSDVEGKDLFSLVSHDEKFAARATEVLSASNAPNARPSQSEAAESASVVNVPSGEARLVFRRRLAGLRRRRRSEGIKV